MAFVAYVPPDGTEGFCSGTVIAPNVVLTAAHCAVGPTANYEVVTGSLDRTNENARQVSGVSRIILNPGYTRKAAQYDVALFVLKTRTTAPSVRLATDPEDKGLIKSGAHARFAGWGLMAHKLAPKSLRWAPTVVQSDGLCGLAAALRSGLRFRGRDELCVASSRGRHDSVCQGDSGGPLLARDAGGEVEIGITHVGSAECDGRIPQFFIRADKISAWAESEVSSLEAAAPPVSTTTTTPTTTVSTTPTTTPTTTATTGPTTPTPLTQVTPGLYVGRTSQNTRVQLRISASSGRPTWLILHFKYQCPPRARTFSFWFKPFSYPGLPFDGLANWSLNADNGLGFDRVFPGNTGGHYSIRGTFTATGTVAGTFRWSSQSARYGSCDSGLVHWSAQL